MTKADSPTKTCTTPGCTKALRAKGMCVTHYNQQNATSRHKTTTVPCDGCGTPCQKELSRLNRYPTVYCTPKCKAVSQRDAQWLERGASCKLPADHWARWYGQTCEWAPPPKAECAWCGSSFYPASVTNTMCSRACSRRAAKARRRARERRADGTYTWAEVTRIWISINRCCAYCDQPTTEYEPDHVIPLSKGGSNSITNVVPSCKSCNSSKRDWSLTEWYDDRARRQLPARTLNSALTHLTWARLAA